MYETITLDPKTLIIKSDNESELSEIIDFISKKGKEETIKELLKFASENRKIVKNYKFNREESYLTKT
ncbi:MAG: hypothetical protein LBT84_03620 [Spirochaetia bacterium]|jgi:hypothetical protein|nr:hypothetical protein [Spirochaetia bacterium]